jgi:hypothetical protein
MNLKYGQNSKTGLIETAADYLRQGPRAGGDTQANEFSKDQEAKKLIGWIQSSKR